ncbi:acyltransferase family protein [Roseococcus sp. YIM B11640]|uniref:acyltransferase family protein n=1 Tax=Roseococcus sp. YIM B11640 TaxID=3133973 RepID=UPI003C7EAE42
MKRTDISVAAAMEQGSNNFDLIRLIAALTVLISHSFSLISSPHEPFIRYLGNYDSGGGLAVSIFFFISGFLIYRSSERHNMATYMKSRALRIMPGLLVCLIFTTFIVGPIFTNLSLGNYFTNSETHNHLLGFFVFNITTTLPGVFSNLPIPAVNGSLWTLPIEATFYLLFPVFLSLGLINGRTLLLCAILAIGSYVVLPAYLPPEFGVLRSIQFFPALRMFCFFTMGACYWEFRDRIKLSAGTVACFAILLYLGIYSPAKFIIYVLSVGYLVMYFGLAFPIKFALGQRVGDISYGTYLYAFPVQQAVITVFGASIGALGVSAIAAPIAMGLGYLSWRFVEKPFLQIRHAIPSYDNDWNRVR